MAIQMLTYDDANMQPGKFYVIHVNADLAPALVEVTDNLEVLAQSNRQEIEVLKDADTQLDLKINQDRVLILDNQARINNLEDRDLRREFLAGMDMASIRAYFEGKNEIKIQYGRKEITNIIVYRQVSITPDEKVFEEITSGIQINYHEKYNIDTGDLIEKYVIIKTDIPVTGYALIL